MTKDKSCEVDLFGHHMHSVSSSYNSNKKFKESFDYDNIQEFLDDFYQEKEELPEGNHFVDYFEIRKKVPESINLVMNDTTHEVNEDRSYDELYRKVKEEGGEFRKFDKHIYFEIDDKEAVVINSAEVGVGNHGHDESHFTVTGLEMGYEEYDTFTMDELSDFAKEAEITSVAHQYLPLFHTGKEVLYEFLEETKKKDFRAGINYSTGYFKLGNKLARGEIQKYNPLNGFFDRFSDKLPDFLVEQLRVEKDIVELAEEYDLPLIPEIDAHSIIPEKFQGAGVLKESVMEDFKEGKFPADELLETDVLDYGNKEISVFEFIRMYSDVFPGWNYEKGNKKGIKEKILSPVFNYYPQEHKEDFEKSIKSLEEMDVEEIKENSYPLVKGK